MRFLLMVTIYLNQHMSVKITLMLHVGEDLMVESKVNTICPHIVCFKTAPALLNERY